MDSRIEKLAEILVNYSCHVQKGEKVYIHYIGKDTTDLARQLVKEVYKAGGVPFVHFTDPQVQREVLLHCTKEQMEEMAKVDAMEMDMMDCYIAVRGSDNVSELSDVPSEQMGYYEKYYATPVHHERRVPHTKWVVLRYPNKAMAQLSQTSTEAFEDFYYKVCTLDYSKMNEAMSYLVDYMNRTDKVRMTEIGRASCRERV